MCVCMYVYVKTAHPCQPVLPPLSHQHHHQQHHRPSTIVKPIISEINTVQLALFVTLPFCLLLSLTIVDSIFFFDTPFWALFTQETNAGTTRTTNNTKVHNRITRSLNTPARCSFFTPTVQLVSNGACPMTSTRT